MFSINLLLPIITIFDDHNHGIPEYPARESRYLLKSSELHVVHESVLKILSLIIVIHESAFKIVIIIIDLLTTMFITIVNIIINIITIIIFNCIVFTRLPGHLAFDFLPN